MWNLINLTLHN